MMRKYVIKIGLMILGFSIMLTIGFNMLKYSINENAKEWDFYVGKSIIMDKDTLTVLNYSRIESTYTLSNGITVNSKLVEDRIKK